MKTFINLVTTAICLILAINASYAQTKYDVKTAKKTAKTLTKEGWRTDGGHRTIESYLLKYYEIETENELIIGRSSDQGNEKIAKNAARRDAIREFIELASTEMKGIGNELEGTLDKQAIDNLTTASISKFAGKAENEISVSFVLYKTQPNGKISCQSYCYINKKKYESLKQEAFKEAINEAEGVKNYNKKVQDIIDAQF